MEQEKLYSDWQSTAGRVFWGIVIVAISTIFVNFFDLVAGVIAFIEWALRHSQGNDVGFTDTTVFKIGVTAHIVNIIGYVLYFVGLTSFAQIQQTANAAKYVYKARTALIVLLITSIVGTVFMFVAEIPFIGLFFVFVIWLLYVIGYFIMKGAYDGLMHCDDFSGIAKLGAKNVRYAAVCMLRLLFAPIVLFFLSIVLILGSGASITHIIAMAANLEQLAQNLGWLILVLIVINFIILCFMLAWSFCALIWPMMGWYRIKNGGPADVMIIIEEDVPVDDTESKSEEEEQTVGEHVAENKPAETPVVSAPVVKQPETMEYIEQEPVDDSRKKWYYIGGAVAAAVIAVSCFFAFSGGSGNDNNPLGVQKPKWEKFIKVNTSDVKLYKEADVSSSYVQLAVERLDGCMPNECLVWSGDKAPRGYDVSDYNVEANTIFPVLDESDEWYRVHIGIGTIREAYIQKQYCEEVKPEPITKEVITKVYESDNGAYKFVDKGEFANLLILREAGDVVNAESVMLGVLTDGCIVAPNECLCFPQMKDTTGVAIRNVSDTPDSKFWHLTCPDTYWNDTQDEECPQVLDANKLTDSDIQKIVLAMRPQGNTASKVYYYFPTVATDRFIEFEYSFSPATTVVVEEGQTVVTDFRVEGEKLIATIDGEDREVDLDFGNIKLFGVKDLDGDGSMEAVISHFMTSINGEPVDCPLVVYYDAENDKLKQTDEMKLTYESEPTFEGSDGSIIMVQHEGLKTIRYAFEDKKLVVKKEEFKNCGSESDNVTIDDLFSNSEDGEKTLSIDFIANGERSYATLTFSYETGGYYHGFKMTLKKFVLATGEVMEPDITASTFKFLKEYTNGMPDIIGDNYLYRWNGNNYESYGWDGNNFVREDL